MKWFKITNNWLNHKIIYPLFSRIYWNFGIVDRYKENKTIVWHSNDNTIMNEYKFKKGDLKLMRSRLPNGEFVKYLAKTYQLRTILSLEDDYDQDMDVWCKEYGIEHITSLDHVSAKVIFQDTNDLNTYLDIISKEINFPMLIRCRAGADRTGVACALYRIEKQGWSNLMAWLEMLTFFHFPLKFKWASKFVLNYKKV